MLYIGYFRFQFSESENGTQDAEFTYLVEADSIDKACQAMADQITMKHRDLLRSTEQLMLDDCIEIKEIPVGGVLLRSTYTKEHQWPVVTSVLPNNEGDQCADYRQGPDPTDDLEAANAFEQEPFMVRNEDGELV